MQARIKPLGDRALTAEFGDAIDEQTNAQVQSLMQRMERACIRGVTGMTPTFRSLLVCYDPARIRFHQLRRRILQLAQDAGSEEAPSRRILLLPCCYEDGMGEDLPELSRLTGLSESEIVRIHSSVDYRIYMLGFLPGFVYLGGLDPRIHAPRLAVPRKAIPAGAVGIGGAQTGVYPVASPGGWRLIGRTPLALWDASRQESALCRAGEYVRFVPISKAEFDRITLDRAYRPTFVTEEGAT